MSDYYTVLGLEFSDQGVSFSYTTADAIRKEGALQMMQTLFVGVHPDYYDDLADLKGKAEEVLRDALDDYPKAEVVELEAEDESSSDDLGMGWANDKAEPGVDE